MIATIWPTQNIFFENGIRGMIDLLNVDTDFYHKSIVFIDFSKCNLKEILMGKFLCMIPEGVTLVFYCDDYMLPIGRYYSSVIHNSFVFTKKDKPAYVLNTLMGVNDFSEKETCSNTLTVDEFLIIKKILLDNVSVLDLAREQRVNVKTVYSRYYFILKKMRINRIREILI